MIQKKKKKKSHPVNECLAPVIVSPPNMPRSNTARANVAATPIVSRIPREALQALLPSVSRDDGRPNQNGLWIFPGGCAAATDGHKLAMVRPIDGPSWWGDEWGAALGKLSHSDLKATIAISRKRESVSFSVPDVGGWEYEQGYQGEQVSISTSEECDDGQRARMTATLGRQYKHPPFGAVVPRSERAKPVALVGLNPAYLAAVCKPLAAISEFVEMHSFGELDPIVFGARSEDLGVEIIAVIMPGRIEGSVL